MSLGIPDMGSVPRSVLLASADAGLRQRLRASLSGMRWQVREAVGGADAMAQMEMLRPEALVMDNWLPDLEVGEFAAQVKRLYPGVDLLRVDGVSVGGGAKSSRRHELLHALREAEDSAFGKTASEATMPMANGHGVLTGLSAVLDQPAPVISVALAVAVGPPSAPVMEMLPELIGRTPSMIELTRLIRLVAPTTATVLIEGETGTGKEVVAKAIHRLSTRSGKIFTVLNCAAIPESLLEAELFGHTRGAFTGAVQSRTGRIEAAHGGTLFLDEIGEMPMALQSKMLRFLECGELQRVGDNETVRVDVRILAATHQNIADGAGNGTFRLDLYHRLAVFPLEVPALRDRLADLPLLVEHLLAEMGKEAPRKRLTAAAMERLQQHNWPGNVRELAHVLERGAILSGEASEIGVDEIRLRRATR